METDPSVVFGNLFRLLRENAGLTQKELADRVFCSPSLVSAVEIGTKPAKRDLVERVGKELEAERILLTVWPVTAHEVYSPAAMADLEKDAVRIHYWENRYVPGLLQIPDYARCAIRCGRPCDDGAQIEQDVAARMQRKEIFDRVDPPAGWFIIDESVLYRGFGGKKVMRDQLGRMLELADRPNLFIQVMRSSSIRHPGADGPLLIVEYRNSPTVRYTEGRNAGTIMAAKNEVMEGVTYFDIIRSCALPLDESREFIATVREDLYGDDQPDQPDLA